MPKWRFDTTGPHVVGPHRGQWTAEMFDPSGIYRGSIVANSEAELIEECQNKAAQLEAQSSKTKGIGGKLRIYLDKLRGK